MLCLTSLALPYASKLEEQLFYNLGHFGATYLYQTYLNIGMTSDAWTHNIYTPDDSKHFLQVNISFLDTSKNLLTQMTEFAISSDDRDTFIKMIAIIDDLRNEADFMLKYIGSRNEKDMNQYDSYRKTAWDKISKLMNIK
jgi:hypothetical protein